MATITSDTHTFVKEMEERLARELKELELRLTTRLGSITTVAIVVAVVLAKLL